LASWLGSVSSNKSLYVLAYIFVLLATHVGLLVCSATRQSPTPDELAHLVSGLSHWQLGEFDLYRVNPPLARLVATAPVFLFERDQQSWLDLYMDSSLRGRAEFRVAERFVDEKEAQIFEWIVTARISSIGFSVLGCIVCFLWSRELYGTSAGIFSATFWCICPMVLGFGSTITPDVPSASMTALSLYSFGRWIRHPGFGHAYIAGICLGFAELTKSTLVVLLPIYVICIAIAAVSRYLPRLHSRTTVGKRRSNRPKITDAHCSWFQTLLFFLTAWMVLLGGYGFRGVFEQSGDLKIPPSTASNQNSSVVDQEDSYEWIDGIPIPLPRDYVLGMIIQNADMAPGRKFAYLRGELRDHGWWYYYLYAFAVKSSIGLIVVVAFGAFYHLAYRRKLGSDEFAILLVIVSIVALLSWHTGLNKHSRYLLPIYPLLFVWASKGVVSTRSWFRGLAWCSLFSAALSSLAAVPHSMSYFNELVGGSANGRFHLSNSNVDWGQDLFYLKEELEDRNWDKIGMVCWTTYDARHTGINFFLPPVSPSVARNQGDNVCLQPGKYAISSVHLHGYPRLASDGRGGWGAGQPHAFSYFQEFTPVGRVGYSMLLFDLDENDIIQSAVWGDIYKREQKQHPDIDTMIQPVDSHDWRSSGEAP